MCRHLKRQVNPHYLALYLVQHGLHENERVLYYARPTLCHQAINFAQALEKKLEGEGPTVLNAILSLLWVNFEFSTGDPVTGWVLFDNEALEVSFGGLVRGRRIPPIPHIDPRLPLVVYNNEVVSVSTLLAEHSEANHLPKLPGIKP